MSGRRVLHLAFALYVAVTLGVGVPAHHHRHLSDLEAGRCEPLARLHCEEGHDCHDEGGEERHAPCSGHHDSSTCSICFFARALSSWPTLPAAVPTLDVVDIRPQDAPSPVLHSSFVPTLHGRAPPVAA